MGTSYDRNRTTGPTSSARTICARMSDPGSRATPETRGAEAAARYRGERGDPLDGAPSGRRVHQPRRVLQIEDLLLGGQIIVTGTYTGADAETIQQSVATPLEQQMNGVDDMLYMQSTNGYDGSMQLTVTFDIDTDPNVAQVNVQPRGTGAAEPAHRGHAGSASTCASPRACR